LKNLTFHAKATFRKVESSKQRLILTAQQQQQKLQQQQQQQQQPHQSNMQRDFPKTVSPQHGGISNLQLADDDDRDVDDNTNPQRGVLESALEAQTKASTAAARTTRKCFTLPRDPVANDGLDNAEGNLIVFEGDLIPVTNLSILKGAGGLGTLRVLDLLGQGTFAQVFLCECLDTGARIALKVVKNKQAYTRQAAIEIDVFRCLAGSKVNMVQLECYFVHQNHLCLVFELLGLNLYEVLKGRQFRGLPLPIVRSLMRQAIEAVRDLSAKSIVHCDLKPENILLEGDAVSVIGAGDVTAAVSSAESKLKKQVGTPCTEDSCGTTVSNEGSVSGMSESSGTTRDVQGPKIKLIDFGSACFEGRTSHTYIQSRFYRSPEVLVGLPYDSAIDMWSLGCVAAELFLGLPILPGVHEHDQLGRITEMLGPLPDWMLDQGYVC
jgi:dual specificity protein kinase YAK1